MILDCSFSGITRILLFMDCDLGRLRKPLENFRPPSTTELLLSNDGDHLLEGCVTNFFVVCRRVLAKICFLLLIFLFKLNSPM